MSVINLHQYQKTFEGVWWSPQDVDDRYYGRLECRPGDRTELHLLSIGKNAGIRLPDMPAILCGQSEGMTFTLWNCFQRSSHGRRDEMRVTYSVKVVLPGFECENPNDLVFTTAEFSLEHFSDWIGFQAISDRSGSNRKGQIHLQPKEDFEFRVSDGITGSLTQRLDVEYPDHFSINIVQCDSIFLHFDTPKNLNEIKGEMASWRWLISLFVGRPLAETRLSVANQKSTTGVRHDVFYNPGRSFALPKNLDDFGMICPWSKVEATFEETIGKWQVIREKYTAVLQRFFSTVFKSGLFTNEEFLFLAHSIEAFWRSNHGEKPSFRDCIEGCVSQMPSTVKSYIDERPNFSDEVVSQRNYYTHHNPKPVLQGKILDGNDLYHVGQRVRLITEVLLMQELGLPESIVNRAAGRQRMKKLIEYR